VEILHRPGGSRGDRQRAGDSRRHRPVLRAQEENETEITTPGGDAEDLEHLRDMASEAPVIRLVNADGGAGVGKARQRYSHRAVRKRVSASVIAWMECW